MLIFMYMCVLCICVEEGVRTLGTEFQQAVSHTTWFLGFELGSDFSLWLHRESVWTY